MSEYKDYGWEEGATHAHGFLYPTLRALLEYDKSKMILDVGCGNGAMANRLASEGFDIYGTDASESGIAVAKKQHGDRFFVQDLNSQELPKELENKKFDLIISTEVVEHLYNPRGYIKFCKDVLVKNGGARL